MCIYCVGVCYITLSFFVDMVVRHVIFVFDGFYLSYYHFYCVFLTDLGLQQHRLEGEDYIDVIDEFMEAVYTRWPHVIVQVTDTS